MKDMESYKTLRRPQEGGFSLEEVTTEEDQMPIGRDATSC